VNIRFLAQPLFPSYCVAKGGLIQLTKSLAIALAPFNIQVNAILPGWFNTQLTRPLKTPAYEALYAEIIARTPVGRFGNPEECAGAAVFLASRAPDFRYWLHRRSRWRLHDSLIMADFPWERHAREKAVMNNPPPDAVSFAEQVRFNQQKVAADLKTHYDFIVCGSGTSGSVVAAPHTM
jgi:hypothetical protein